MKVLFLLNLLFVLLNKSLAVIIESSLYAGADFKTEKPLSAVQKFFNHKVYIDDKNSLVLRGAPFQIQENKAAPHVVLYLHGNAQNYYAGDRLQTFFDKEFRSKKILIYTLQYPGYSGNRLQMSERSFTQAGVKAYEQLQTAFPESHINIWGYSLGSGVAAQVSLNVENYNLIILSAAWTNFLSLCRKSAGRFSFLCNDQGNEYNTEKAVLAATSPVIFLHGDQDKAIPLSYSKSNIKALQKSKHPYKDQLFIRKGRRHGSLHDPETLMLLGELIIETE